MCVLVCCVLKRWKTRGFCRLESGVKMPEKKYALRVTISPCIAFRQAFQCFFRSAFFKLFFSVAQNVHESDSLGTERLRLRIILRRLLSWKAAQQNLPLP